MAKEDGNLIDGPVMMALMQKESKLRNAKKAAADALKAHHGTVKSFGIKIANFNMAFAQMMASDGGDAFIQDMREQQRLMRLLKLPVGHQFDILDEFDASEREKEETPDSTMPFKKGVIACLADEDEKKCPHAANTEEGQEWLRGFRWAASETKSGAKVLSATSDAESNDEGKKEAAEKPKRRRGRSPKNKTNGVEASA